MAVLFSKRSRMPVHTGAQHDDIRLYLFQMIIVQPHFFHGPGSEAFNDNISPRYKSFSQIYPLRMVQVKRDTIPFTHLYISKVITTFYVRYAILERGQSSH